MIKNTSSYSRCRRPQHLAVEIFYSLVCYGPRYPVCKTQIKEFLKGKTNNVESRSTYVNVLARTLWHTPCKQYNYIPTGLFKNRLSLSLFRYSTFKISFFLLTLRYFKVYYQISSECILSTNVLFLIMDLQYFHYLKSLLFSCQNFIHCLHILHSLPENHICSLFCIDCRLSTFPHDFPSTDFLHFLRICNI